MADGGPIIITGADRSGTTLLYALLGSHPNVSMVRRTNLWRWFYGNYGDLADPANLNRCLATMLEYSRLNVLEPDPESIILEFSARPPNYGQLFSVMHEQHAARRGRGRWSDKSLHTEHYASQIFDDLPEARILHMVRDPRDRYASIVRRYESAGRAARNLASTTGRWIASVRAGEANVKAFGDSRYRMVRYETLVAEPEPTMRAICDFVGEYYEPELLTMRAMADDADSTGNSSYETLAPGEISTRSIGRFRERLPDESTALIQTIAGPWMARMGYRPEPIIMGLGQTARFWAMDAPFEAAKTAAWLLRTRGGGEQGRTVPSHRLKGGISGK